MHPSRPIPQYLPLLALALLLEVSSVPQVYGLPAPLTPCLEAAAALTLLLVALGWVGLALIGRRESTPQEPPRRLPVLVLLLAWLALARDVSGVLVGPHPLLVALFAGGALLFAAVLVRPPRASGWLVVGAVLLGSGVRLACLPAAPLPASAFPAQSDSWWQQQMARLLARGYSEEDARRMLVGLLRRMGRPGPGGTEG
jgi:hypothetical protein